MRHISDQPPVDLFLRTFGNAGLYANSGSHLLLAPGKPLALLVFLALAPGRRTSRESLIGLLWSDLEPERARSALRQSLFHLRKVLGDDAVAGTEELTLHRPIDADRDQFLAALEAGDLERSLELYLGDFLPEFGVPGGAAFEHWADLERDRLRAGFVRGAELLVRRHLNQSRIKEGRQLARQVRDLAPQVEAAGRLVLEASIAGHDFVSAIMESNTLEQWAAAEGVALEPATRSAIARARRVAPSTELDGHSTVLVAELTGREHEFTVITSAWETVRTGPARHLHLTAPAGFGKTRLLRDAVARLAATGASVISLRGTSGDRDVPYAFAGDLAAALAELPGAAGVAPASAATLLALNPTLSAQLSGSPDTASGDDALRRRIHALADLVHSVAEEKRFVLAIDDLHWIDLSSFRVLEALWGRLNRAHVLCLTASRPDRAPSDEHCTVLPLLALTEPQVVALVSALGFVPPDQAWSGSFASGMFAATHGSPLLVLETLQYALDQGMLAIEDDEWRCLDEGRLFSLLRAGEALRERLRALPPTQLWMLALLATAGTPLDRNAVATVAGISRDELVERLEPLERQGFVVRMSAGLVPAHDEIADAARALLSDEQRAAAERCVGEYVARAAHFDASGLLRAARHLVAAGDDAAVRLHFRHYAQLVRQLGDRRTFRELAAEFVGDASSSPVVRALVQSLPRLWRLQLWSPARQTFALMALVLLPGLVAVAIHTRAAGNAATQRLFLVDSAQTIGVVAVHQNDWDASGAPLLPTSGTSVLLDAARAYTDLPPALSPDTRSAAWVQDSGDSTTLDIWLRTPAGVRRLTRANRDDLVNDWLPDGSALVGYTDRWSPRDSGGYDIAVFDTASGAARQVTRGPAHDSGPVASPDGTRIAFMRESDDFPPRVCVTTIDGRNEPDCRLIDGRPVNWLLGWSGLDEVIVMLDASDARPLIAYDWARNTRRTVLGPHVLRGRLSPDRRWVDATLRVDGVREFRDWIVPLDRPDQARQVSGSGGGFVRWWEGPRDIALLIDHIEFSDSIRVVSLGVSTRLRVRSSNAAGIEIPLRAPLRWASSDTRVATVDSLGVIRPIASGVTTITASLVDWRTTSRKIVVEGESPTTIMSEQWDDSWPSRWIAWGDPQPLATNGPNGVRGFWNNGDGIYPSMGLLRQALSARHGLGVELRLSTPITRTKWQRLRVSLVAGIDTALLLRADQRKAPPPVRAVDADCGMTFPGEGRWAASRMSMTGSVSADHDLGAAATPLRTGAWWTLRLQILPDGRCGVAINNRVVWLSPEPVLMDEAFRVRLGDESAGAKLLHGPLQIWTGVRTDIDWAKRE